MTYSRDKQMGKIQNLKRTTFIAFTLVELLVVVAIIAILMGTILSIIPRAQELSKRSHCASNLKNLTVAWRLFATDNNDKLCSPSTLFNTKSNHKYWTCDGPDIPYEHNPVGGTEMAIKGTDGIVINTRGEEVFTREGVLWPYVQDMKAYKCLSDRTSMIRSYSMANSMGREYILMTEIREASEKIVFIDATSDFSGLAAAAALLDPPEHYSHMWLVGSFNGYSRTTNDITSRHGGGCNMSFADGHTEYWKWKRVVNINDDDTVSYHKDDIKKLSEACKAGQIYK